MFFQDVLVRFGYHLPEHEHPWEGEWFDDAFEAAALDLRATGHKLLRAIEQLDAAITEATITDAAITDTAITDAAITERALGRGATDAAAADDAEAGAEAVALHADLVVAYLDRLIRGVVIAIPCCFGQDGRTLAAARSGGPAAMADAVRVIDPTTALAITVPAEITALLGVRVQTHHRDLFTVIDAAGTRPALPRSIERIRAESLEQSLTATVAIDGVLAAVGRWGDALLPALQSAIAERADDGADLLDRWTNPDWSMIRRTSSAIDRHLPHLD